MSFARDYGSVKRMASCSYEKAIFLVLGARHLTRLDLLGYFDEHEHGLVGEALDAMVVAGSVALRRGFYSNARTS